MSFRTVLNASCVVLVLSLLLSVCGDCGIIRVKPGGSDSNDGSSWELAKGTVQGAINASISGDEIWVAAGVYYERITLKHGVDLYGGFAGTETERSQRNWKANETVLDGNQQGSVVTVPTGVGYPTRIDGFVIRNGRAESGGGIYFGGTSAAVVSNNTISGNSALSGSGGGICCSGASPLISNNTVMGNSGPKGGGISCLGSSAVICNNVICANNASSVGGGIYCLVSDYSYAAPSILNNTLAGNKASSNGGGLYLESGYYANGVARVSNNIVAFNDSGIYCYFPGYSAKPVLKNNCVYNPKGYNYSGISAGVGDISADPLFESAGNNDYHLLAASPCINAGWNDAPGMPATDKDGLSRIALGTVDIGAYEYRPRDIGQIKFAEDGCEVVTDPGIVTAVFGDFFYVESPKRTAGIRVQKPGHGLAQGSVVVVRGIIQTNSDAERYIEASVVTVLGSAAVEPLAMSNQFVGGGDLWMPDIAWSNVPYGQKGVQNGYGLNNIGLLIKTWGRVISVGEGEFRVDDGSILDSGVPGELGVRVVVPDGVEVPSVGSIVSVTGISSCRLFGGSVCRLVRVRCQADIQQMAE
ncbi:MAG: choice-of-anchor Q domain-containing protein [Armatimonadota bacterium]|nr:choice-of-anchor Q domain-containing protein [Armatimonadota bacterium]